MRARRGMKVTLPYPPSVNHYWRKWRNRMVISREGRAYRERVGSILAARGGAPLSGPLDVSIEVFPPDRRRRDIDNVQKGLLDALEHGGAYGDDYQIARLITERAEVTPGGKVVVEITEREK